MKNCVRIVLNSFNLSVFVSMSPDSTVLPDLQTLEQRLLVAEELGGQVRRDLSSILEQLGNISKAGNITHPSINITNTTISTGSILT